MKSISWIVALGVACGGDPAREVRIGQRPDGPTTPDVLAMCGPAELCGRTIECGIAIEADVCAGWYDDPSNCVDMDTYTICNCDCGQEPACDAYLACGELCFRDHC